MRVSMSVVLAMGVLLFVGLQIWQHCDHTSVASGAQQAPQRSTSWAALELAAMDASLTELNGELREIAELQRDIAKIRASSAEVAKAAAAKAATLAGGGSAQQQQLHAVSSAQMHIVHSKPSVDTQDALGVQERPRATTAIALKTAATTTTTTAKVAPSGTAKTSVSKQIKAVLFTMDSITSYEDASKRGGAAGELLIRRSLSDAFAELRVSLRTVTSDAEFNGVNGGAYDIIIIDPWTWAAKGWKPKAAVKGHEDRTYVLDFFGSEGLRGGSFNVPPKRFLTAFGSPWNTFLGYSMPPVDVFPAGSKQLQGVVWGKDPNHFAGKRALLGAVAAALPVGAALVTVSSKIVLQHPRITHRGHQTSEGWHSLLRESRFLIGLGNPLLGPSAIDAVANGCMYINPILKTAVKGRKSQHPYAAEVIGEPYVCSYPEDDASALKACIDKALAADLPPHLPADFEHAAYIDRVRKIFNL